MENKIHPLTRHGCSQRERLIKALIPENLLLDDRSIADIIAFVGQYAEQIRYWNSDNQDDGDWSCFWKKDATTLFAIIAAIDIDIIRVEYRNKELEFIQACKKEKAEGKIDCELAVKYLYELVLMIFEIAKKLQNICEKLPENNPIKIEVQSFIKTKLGISLDTKGNKNYDSPLGKLISFHKGSVSAELLEEYKVFIGESNCQKAWNLTEHDFLNCIDFKENINADNLEEIWRLFLAFFKVLSLIVSKAEKSFQNAINSRKDHPPHITLLLSFLMLFRRYHQSEMNGMVGKHLLFYYKDVLRLQERKEIPDKVHLVFEIAQNIESYKLSKDTLFLGGKDSLGLDRLYALNDEYVFNKAKLVEKQNLYFYKFPDGKSTIPIRLKGADMKDGLKIPFISNKLWGALSGEEFIKKEFFKKNKGQKNNTVFNLSDPKISDFVGSPGLIIESPELWMDKSKGRKITITFDDNFDFKKLGNIELKISTIESVNKINFSSEATRFNDFFTKENEKFDKELDLKGDNSLYQIRSNTIEIFFTSNFPAITPLKLDKANPLSLLKSPFIIIQAQNGSDYELLKDKVFKTIKINTETVGLKSLSLQIGDVSYPATAEIPWVRSKGDVSPLNLYATAHEISYKKFNNKPNFFYGIKPIDKVEPTFTRTESLSRNIAPALLEPSNSVSSPFLIGESFNIVPDLISTNFDTNNLIKYSKYAPVSYFNLEINEKPTGNQVVNIFKIPSESVSLDYISEGVSYSENKDKIKLYWYNNLDGYSEVKNSNFIINNNLPDFDNPIDLNKIISEKTKIKTADGNLRLAFESLIPGQTLSLLFHFAEGTGNPEHIAPDEIVWSYMRSNDWIRIPPQYILFDETLGLRQTGIVKIQIPFDINTGNTAAIGTDGRFEDLYWIQASANEVYEKGIMVDALPMLIDIYPQAATAIFENHENDLAHIEKGLPENTISQLRYRDSNIVKVEQPFLSFDGRLSETGNRMSYYQRISERLRHKQRAITIWDYERITLETFPKVSVAKCLSHTNDKDVESPNYVTMGVIPYPEKMIGNFKYYPSFIAGDLEEIENHLNQNNSFFVSGQGGGVVCCCSTDSAETDCGCGCNGHGHLVVRNAIFEPIQLTVCVKFRLGKDEYIYKKQLNNDLKGFLAPWATDTNSPILFSASIYADELLKFLENQDYIDVVMKVGYKHFENRNVPKLKYEDKDFEFGEKIEPFTSRSVLTTYLDILNEDNPNVLDHEISVIQGEGCCDGCEEVEKTEGKLKNTIDEAAKPAEPKPEEIEKTQKEDLDSTNISEVKEKIKVKKNEKIVINPK